VSPSFRPLVYLASPLGFDDPGRAFRHNVLLPTVARVDWELLDPWEHPQPTKSLAGSGGDHSIVEDDRLNRIIGQRNIEMLERANGLFAWLDGVDLDSGTASEVGFACARGIPIVGVRTDARMAGDNLAAVVNLQVLAFLRHSGGELYSSASEGVAALDGLLRA
jgi:nucleoside 2-deoxyribosyltransferase